MTNFLSIPIMFTLCLIATGSYGQEDVDFTHISFSSETEFLISVEEVVSQQTQPSKGAAAIKLFSGDSAQTNSSNLEQLISAYQSQHLMSLSQWRGWIFLATKFGLANYKGLYWIAHLHHLLNLIKLQ